MMSIPEIIKAGLAAGTKDAAAAIVTERVGEMMLELGYKPEDARKTLLSNIGYYTGYLDHETADKVMELFDTEHPYFGRKHYTPEEILKMGYEIGRKMREEKAT